MNKQFTYTDAFDELQTLVADIERGDISIDDLSEKVKRATQLIGVCKAKLTATEEEVSALLSNLAEGQADDTPSDEEQ